MYGWCIIRSMPALFTWCGVSDGCQWKTTDGVSLPLDESPVTALFGKSPPAVRGNSQSSGQCCFRFPESSSVRWYLRSWDWWQFPGDISQGCPVVCLVWLTIVPCLYLSNWNLLNLYIRTKSLVLFFRESIYLSEIFRVAEFTLFIAIVQDILYHPGW